MPDLETEEEAAKRITKKRDNDEIFDVLNKFKNNMEARTSDLDKKFMNKGNKLRTKLDKLNNNIKKLDSYIKENNDKKN